MTSPNLFEELLEQHKQYQRHVPSLLRLVFHPTLYALFGWKWRGKGEEPYAGDGLAALLSMLSYAVRAGFLIRRSMANTEQMEHFPKDEYGRSDGVFTQDCLWTLVLLERSINELFMSYLFEIDCKEKDVLRARIGNWKRWVISERDGIDDPCDFEEERRWIPETLQYK